MKKIAADNNYRMLKRAGATRTGTSAYWQAELRTHSRSIKTVMNHPKVKELKDIHHYLVRIDAFFDALKKAGFDQWKHAPQVPTEQRQEQGGETADSIIELYRKDPQSFK
jgi:hypothetical protein